MMLSARGTTRVACRDFIGLIHGVFGFGHHSMEHHACVLWVFGEEHGRRLEWAGPTGRGN